MRLIYIVLLIALIPTFSPAQEINLEKGLIAYYPFDDDANDISGNDNHGTIHGARLEPAIRCDGAAYRFDGVDDYIDFGNAESLNSGYRGLTISFMVRHDEFTPDDYRLLLGKWAFKKETDQYAIFLNNANKLSFAVADGNVFGYGFYSKSNIEPGEWYHVIVAWNRRGKMGIFINGELDNQGEQSGNGLNEYSNITLKAGRQIVGQDRPFKGYLDEVRIYNRTLSLDEIKALFRMDYFACNQFTLRGYVYDKDSRDIIPNAKISFEDIRTGEKMFQVQSDETGYYEANLPIGFRYGFYAEADDYLAINENISTEGIVPKTVVEQDLFMVRFAVGSTIKLNNLFFDTAKSTIKDESYPELNRLLQLFDQVPGLVIEIAGHTDWVGSDSYNQRLSEDRANAVRNYLVEQGVSPDRVEAVGYGEKQPVATNDTDEGRQLNRRVEFKILAK
jgi:outer membrane protein OmpA-like peptidoglycan-associated protein